ncbi:WxL domain-containing protein [Enterococcus gallinarum]
MMQALFISIGMVYSETTIDTEEQEQIALPPMKNLLKEEQASFFFTRTRMQGMVKEPIQVTFFSNQEVSEAQVFLPEEVTILKEQLPSGISVEEGEQPNEWIVRSKRAQHTFVLTLIVEKEGNYELLVEETTAHLEIREQEKTSEEVPVEEAELFEDDPAEQDELKEENEVEEGQENEQPVKEVNETVSKNMREKQVDEEEPNALAQVVETTVFDGEIAEVATMAQFREAIDNPDIGVISIQANITETTANILTVNRPLLIQGNGYTLTFGINEGYFQLEEVSQASTVRIENAILTKVGVTPLINATVENSKNWTVELEDITEVNANTMRLASLPEGSIHFTGGVSKFTCTASTQTFIEAKKVVATNQAEVTISRGNATVFFSSATVADPKITVEQGSTITITTTSGVANTIDLKGENPEIFLQSGELDVATVGTTNTPTNTTNNTIALTGNTPKITMNSSAQLTVQSTLAKRGIHLAGNNAQLLVSNSELSITSATQVAINITGNHSSFSSENSTIQLVSTTGIAMNMTGESPQLIFDSSTVNFTSSSGQRLHLEGANPLLSLSNTKLTMETGTGRGIYLTGATPRVLMDHSQLLLTSGDAFYEIALQGTDALLSLSNQSKIEITGEDVGSTGNILIGDRKDRPKLSVTGGSRISITAASKSSGHGDSQNQAIHLSGENPKVTVTEKSAVEVLITSGPRKGLYLQGSNPEVNIENSNIQLKSAESYAINTTSSTAGNTSIVNSTIDAENSVIALKNGNKTIITNSIIRAGSMWFHANRMVIEQKSLIELNSSIDHPAAIEYMQGSLNSDNIDAQLLQITTGSIVDIKRTDGSFRNGARIGGNSTVSVDQGGKLYIYNLGDGIPNDSQNHAPNAGLTFKFGNSNKIIVKDPGSEVSIIAKNGSAITASSPEVNQPTSLDIEVSNGGYFSAVSNTATVKSGTVAASILNINFDNPLFLDFRNLQSDGGVIFSTKNNTSTLVASNSDLALWHRLSDLDSDPTFNFQRLDYSFSGKNFSTLVSTSRPKYLNTSIIGTSGLSQFSRLSSNNGRWAIADELRVPTNADNKIHGRVSLPVGLYDSRPAWDNEATVTIEVESPSGEKKQEYTAKTVGNTKESPGISIYGEKPRGGLFEIELDEPLEAGSKVRISKVELTSGELGEGFEHQILTDTVEVFPIIPPKPAKFSSSIIAQNTTTLQGVTDNLDAEVTATLNGEPLNIEAVAVEADGRFLLDLSEVSLEVDDEIQVFLRDTEGSAASAGIVNPPETNNIRGNINPSTELTFHDATFEPATTLIVGNVGSVSPLDPLNPDLEVNPENKPELPEDQGILSIDFVSSFNFGTQVISAQDQTYYAQPQRLMNEDGTVNGDEIRPNYVQISDRRPKNKRNGWQLDVTQNEQFKGENNQELFGASLSLLNQQVTSTQDGMTPVLQSVSCVLIPGNRRTLLKAQGNEGAGTWIYRFGDTDTKEKSVTLNIPKGTNPEATDYSTTLIWELSMVPD